MRERADQILKIACFGLAVLLLVELIHVSVRLNPLRGVTMPEVPSLPADANAPKVAKVASKGPVPAGTNSPATGKASKTNASLALADTNVVSRPNSKKSESNSAPVRVVTAPDPMSSSTSNILAAVTTDTNLLATNVLAGTNVARVGPANTNKTNSIIAKSSGIKKAGPMLPPMMMGMGGGKASSLAPEIQARVDRVTDSEILAPVVHPMPMALLGIAGNVAFLRSPSGQTGLVKEGDDLGEIKLLHIGTNRVLIEQDGQKKELMIFSGFGGESLLSKPTDTSDETTKE
jgi:hypothetical protein